MSDRDDEVASNAGSTFKGRLPLVKDSYMKNENQDSRFGTASQNSRNNRTHVYYPTENYSRAAYLPSENDE